MAGGRVEIEVVPDVSGFPGKVASGLKGLQGIAGTIGKGLGVAVAAGAATAAIGLKSVIEIGIDYQSKLNELQAVSGATALQMAQIGQTAKALGADLTLPATSAAGAAAAMLELSKGGLSVDASMKAAKGTLQLAAAAQIDAAAAAEIQSNALNQFGLSADHAGQVADVLANTANAASGSIGDIALALKYVGPVAKSVGVSIGDTSTAIGLLANKGIQADQAGTSLRAMLAGLAAPSKPAAKALAALGVEAFDSSGKFVGFRTVIDQLNKAQKTMTQEQFASAAATAFGREPLAAIVALASSGAPAFDEMATAVNRQGGAADVAAAKMKGLGGAWEGFKSQLETAGISIFESIDGPLESVVRKGSDLVEKFTPAIARGIDGAVAAGQLFGPELAKAIESRASALGDVASRLLGPLVQGVKDGLVNGLEIGVKSVQDFADVVHKGVDAVEPLAKGVGKVVESFSRADGPIGAFGAALGIAYDIVKGLVGIVAPVVGVVADLVSGFADLPGPIQAAAVAILALKVGPSILSSLKGAFSGSGKEADDASKKTGLFGKTVGLIAAPVKLVASGLSSAAGTVQQFSGEMSAQQKIAAATGGVLQNTGGTLRQFANDSAGAGSQAQQMGQRVGVAGAAMAAFNTSTIPAVAAARSFRDQTVAIKEGAAAAGEPISTMGAAVGTLVERSPALSAMRDAFHGAADGAGRFGTVAGVAAAAGSGLKSAATGIIGAFGGPFGIAIGLASIGLGILAGKQEDAAREAASHSASVDTLSTALRDSNGIINDTIRELTAKRFLGDEFKVAAEAANKLKVSIGDIVNASLNGGGELDALRSRLQGIIDAHTTLPDVEANAAAGIQDTSSHIDDEGLAAQNLLKALNNMAGGTEEAKKKNEELDKAISEGRGSMLDATQSGRTFAGAMKTLADRTASADDKARALKDALDALSGGQVGLDEAMSHVNEQFDRLGDTFGDNVDKSKGFGDALLTSAGRINTTTENGRSLRDSLDEITSSTVDVAQRTFDMTGSLDDAKKVVQDSRDRFIAMADKMGLSADQAGILADQMGLVPGKTAAFLDTNFTESQKELLLFQGVLQNTPPGKDVIIRSLTDDAKKKLEEFGFKVTTLPDGQISVHAETGDAKAKLDNFVSQPRTATVNVRVVAKSAAFLTDAFGNADGNIVRFAAGGFAGLTPMKGGIASIVPPNTWRVVGDRLRDDEAYIPINRSTRSVSILQQTADQMGFALLRRFASGGVAASGSSSTVTGTREVSRGGDTFNIWEQNDPVSTAVTVQRLQSFKARLR